MGYVMGFSPMLVFSPTLFKGLFPSEVILAKVVGENTNNG